MEKIAWKINLEGSGWKKDIELVLRENLSHYKVATGLWFTAARSGRGPWSPRLNVEQHHDWDATSLHSPPLQQLWLTAQHALFSPRKRALRMKPVFFSELSFVSFKVFLELFWLH